MKTYLTANISTKTARQGSSAWTPPKYVYGETPVFALSFEQDVRGNTIIPELDIRAIKVAVGEVDARPVAEKWALQVGAGAQTVDNTTAQIGYDATAAELKAAINAQPEIVNDFGAATVTKDGGTWTIVFGDGEEQVPVKVVDNTVEPVSFGRVEAAALDGVWRHRVRLTQAPVAFTSLSEEVLPDAPVITQVVEGQGTGLVRGNEIQKLKIAANFTGTYRLKRFDQSTTPLISADTVETIQAALAAAFGDNFAVTDGDIGEAFIEFINDLGEAPQPELVVEVVTAPIADLTFSLALTSAELSDRLKETSPLTLPMEVRIQVADAEENLKWLVAFRQDITLLAPVAWPEMASTPHVDFIRPPSPQTYQAFSPDTIITGHQFAPFVLGDGSATVFTCDHGLDTDLIFVQVWENTTPGTVLREGADYSLERSSADSVTITAIGAAPAADSWLAIVITAQTVAAFADGLTIEIGQVNGLAELLEDIQTLLEQFRELIPTTTPGAPVNASSSIVIPLPKKEELYPGTWGAEVLTDLEKNLTSKGRRLQAAIHDAAATSLTVLPVPAASAHAGEVYQNNTGDAITVAGKVVEEGGYFGSDGSAWYRLTRSGNTNSYFPSDLEREFWRIEISPEMLRTGKRLDVEVKFEARTVGTNTDLQAVLVVEWGNVLSQSAPVGSAIALSGNGTGTHTLSRETGAVGVFTVDHTTDLFTLTGHDLANGEVVTATNSGGALPAGMSAGTSYVVRDVSGATFKLALLTTDANFEDIDWQVSTPLLRQRIILSPILQPAPYGVSVIRSVSAITAEQVLYGSKLGVAVAPPLARFALRARLINIDTRNPLVSPRGFIFYRTEGTAKI